MPSKQVTISARISHEDAEFISQMEIPGAQTPSDKLRAIIAETQRRRSREPDYAGSLQMIQEMILPVTQEIRKKEVEHAIHSEVIARFAEWLPDALAFFISAIAPVQNKNDQNPLFQLEHGIVDRLFRLLTAFLQLAVTDSCPCYQPDAIQKKIAPILDLCDIITSRQKDLKGA